jgi:hypothetical protein
VFIAIAITVNLDLRHRGDKWFASVVQAKKLSKARPIGVDSFSYYGLSNDIAKIALCLW